MEKNMSNIFDTAQVGSEIILRNWLDNYPVRVIIVSVSQPLENGNRNIRSTRKENGLTFTDEVTPEGIVVNWNIDNDEILFFSNKQMS